MISNHMILNRDFKSSVWFLILILKSFCTWFMILNHQNLPANHRILSKMRFLLQSLTQHISWNGCRLITVVNVTSICWSCRHDGYSQYHCCGKYKQSADSWPGRWRWLRLWREQLQFIGSCVGTSQVKAQAMNFLSDADKSLSRLHFFPAVRRLFLKFNTALPSSPPVKRLFSIAGLIETSSISRLSDSFEKLLMLKVNKVWFGARP